MVRKVLPATAEVVCDDCGTVIGRERWKDLYENDSDKDFCYPCSQKHQ